MEIVDEMIFVNVARALVLVVLVVSVSGCGKESELSFDIPSGRAANSLKLFAKQANVEIIFNSPSVDGIVTGAVYGRMTPRAALVKMLDDTDLSFEEDTETGAYAVTMGVLSDARLLMESNDAYSNLGYVMFKPKKIY